MTFDYTDCDLQTPSASADSLSLTNLTSFSYSLKAGQDDAKYNPPQFAFLNRSSDSGVNFAEQQQCYLQFDVPIELDPTVLLYYKHHKLLPKSSTIRQELERQDQLKGKFSIYPCGLIANSIFNDTFSPLTLLTNPSTTYTFSEQGIAWPGEADKYAETPGYSLDDITPPPNWALQYPNGYTNSTPPPNLKTNEHFQNWMRTAGLPTFTKLWGRNDADKLQMGRYQVIINMNFPVRSYKGRKEIVISTVSWIGGKNPFLGWAYVAAASLFVALAILGTIRHMIKPRSVPSSSRCVLSSLK
ncbi:hypothetical protein NLI96_g6941 [Meripilus lineatus]|uniref:Cell cycle control protein n=1 Tax=Meripilus lineatus TaxID=2056292 RepID=A0AAD5YHP8_9APHY|nr:hypothetical protein NLI96_g6941 [Physisporinus lineatus]